MKVLRARHLFIIFAIGKSWMFCPLPFNFPVTMYIHMDEHIYHLESARQVYLPLILTKLPFTDLKFKPCWLIFVMFSGQP